MNNFPLISVAVATYNGSLFIREQLDSILTQTYPNVEIIIVDDCSTDNTVDILKEYLEIHKNIQLYVNDENLGVNKTFNKALTFCHGDFIAISDQDDIWLSNKLKDSISSIDTNILLYSNSELIDERGNSLGRRKTRRTQLHSGAESRIFTLTNRTAGHTFFFKAGLLEYVLPIPLYCHYDWWIAFVATNIGRIIFVESSFVMHRIHLENQTKKMRVISSEEGFIFLKRWVETILSFEFLKNRFFFEELNLILNIESLILKKVRFILFQIKYRNVLFDTQGFWSTINRARKLNLPHIPD